MKKNYIFVYGLLKSIYDNEPARFIRENCSLIGEGSFSGKLYDIGSYPGAIFDLNSDSKVYGEVFQIVKNEDELVSFLDQFEGVGDDFEQPNEYVRKHIPITTSQGIISASCYLYNWNLDNHKVIDSGRYKNTKGNR